MTSQRFDPNCLTLLDTINKIYDPKTALKVYLHLTSLFFKRVEHIFELQAAYDQKYPGVANIHSLANAYWRRLCMFNETIDFAYRRQDCFESAFFVNFKFGNIKLCQSVLQNYTIFVHFEFDSYFLLWQIHQDSYGLSEQQFFENEKTRLGKELLKKYNSFVLKQSTIDEICTTYSSNSILPISRCGKLKSFFKKCFKLKRW